MGESDIKVSVLSLVYNHEAYLEQFIESLVSQKTNFKYEIIIHDDCSTDKSLTILKKYQSLYPDLITIVEEEENQFSKGRKILFDILYDRTHGKYIALCEGDDFWIDENKLQKQYDFMEKHPQCSMCCHNTEILEIASNQTVGNFNDWTDVHKMSDDEIFNGWNVHTSSYFIKKTNFRYCDELPKIWCGDFAMLTYSYVYGEVYALPDVMSVYRKGNACGILKGISSNIRLYKTQEQQRIAYLNGIDKLTQFKYQNVIKKKIEDIENKFFLIEKNIGARIIDFIENQGVSNVILYGCGSLGKNIADSIDHKYIRCFIESNDEGIYDEIPVLYLNKIDFTNHDNDVIIVTPFNAYESIKNNLKERNFKGTIVNIKEITKL